MTSPTSAKVVQPYLFFEGRCEEALEFYRTALGAETLMLMRFKDSPDPEACAGGSAEKIMHSSFRIGETTLFASDGRCGGKQNFEGVSLSLSVPTIEESEKTFAALSEGGQVQMPLTKTFYSPSFGMVADRFGVAWMIIVQQ